MSDKFSIEDRRRFLKVCQKTANALAADRSTKFLPIIVALGFFIGTIAMAFGRTPEAASGPSPPTYINIETHSIAFSALYFWIIPVVFLGSVIGVSQTENAIPRILRRFQLDVERDFGEWKIKLPNAHLFRDNIETPATGLREQNGGIYSWTSEKVRQRLIKQILSEDYQQSLLTSFNNQEPRNHDPVSYVKWRRQRAYLSKPMRLRPGSMTLSLLVVISSLVTGCLISILVPPVGFGCRSQWETGIVAVWLFNAVLDYISWGSHEIPLETHGKRQFWFMFAKDLLSTLITTGTILLTQLGIFNRCSCYTYGGTAGLALPEISTVSQTLFHDIETLYPAIAFLGIAFQLIVFPAIISHEYGMAMRVFLQRDDDLSNMRWWHEMKDFFRRHF